MSRGLLQASGRYRDVVNQSAAADTGRRRAGPPAGQAQSESVTTARVRSQSVTTGGRCRRRPRQAEQRRQRPPPETPQCRRRCPRRPASTRPPSGPLSRCSRAVLGQGEPVVDQRPGAAGTPGTPPATGPRTAPNWSREAAIRVTQIMTCSHLTGVPPWFLIRTLSKSDRSVLRGHSCVPTRTPPQFGRWIWDQSTSLHG